MAGINLVALAAVLVIGLMLFALMEEISVRWRRHK